MIPEIRKRFNEQFTEKQYAELKHFLNESCGITVDFRIAETPVFIPKDLELKVIKACDDVISVLKRPDFMSLTERAMPAHYNLPNQNTHPHFFCLDFGICRDKEGQLEPQLIEMQAFASMFCWMNVLGKGYRKHFNFPEGFTHYLNGFDENSYLNLLKRTIVGNEDPKHVILLEVLPHQQATRVDFYLTRQALGIEIVCLSELVQDGRQLFYLKNGERIQVKRIYNRVIFDDLERQTDFKYSVNLQSDLDVTWVAHPNWFYRLSKFTMPYLVSPFVPSTYFLNTLSKVPDDLEKYVLKPLFSFSGKGVVIDVQKSDIDSIRDPENWILQKKVAYAEAIQSPEGGVKFELRMMYFWPDNAEQPTLAMSLGRLSRGKMIGVQYNKNLNWVGSTAPFYMV